MDTVSPFLQFNAPLWRTAAMTLVLATSFAAYAADPAKKVLVIGIDGMDPDLLQEFVAEGVMPNFKALMEEGDFRPLETTMPPLSPVAWSTFITGMDPGGHGIFDFVHRDPETLELLPAMSKAQPGRFEIKLGTWVLSSPGEVKLMRQGRAFWQILEDEGVPTTIFRMPSNFPPVESKGKSFSGMGTPDMLGTSGTFQYFTNAPPRGWQTMNGGIVSRVRVENGVVRATITGPPNGLRRFPKEDADGASGETEYETPDTEIELTVYVDRDNRTAKIVYDEVEIVLEQGEWSDWIAFDFEMIPFAVSVNAAGRFYLQEVFPNFYLVISTQARYSR